jgi:hypothetical protein
MYYRIIYRDSARIAFEAPGLARVIEGVPGQEIPVQYKEFERIFNDPQGKDGLPEHRL